MSTAQPIIVLSDFGCTTARPSLISTNGNALQLFSQPQIGGFPPRWNTPARANGWNIQGEKQMPGQLLFGVGNGSLSGKIYTVVASGSISIPAGASNATAALVLNQNYTVYGVAPVANSLFSLATPISLAANTTTPFTFSATLAGNGRHNPTLASAGSLVLNSTTYGGSGYSINSNPNQEPQIQLSIGLQFGGTSGAGHFFTATLTQFQILKQASQPY